MTQISKPDARHAFGGVDNACALTETPKAPPQKSKRTFALSDPADIFTRRLQRLATASLQPGSACEV